MIVYRLSRKGYINDLSGHGAWLSGGRWNSKGIAVLYTAASRALAVVEVAVHLPLGIKPVDYNIATIELPDNATILEIPITSLPHHWDSNPPIKDTQKTGNDFIKNSKYLVLQVPSASVSGDYNYLINPRHEDFKKVRIKKVEPFEFDLRLFKK